MKYKVIAVAALAVIIYSCASKSTAPTVEATPKPTGTPDGSKPATAMVLTPDLMEGKSLYENNCAKCHRLYGTKDFSAQEWKPIVERMQKKAHLEDLQGQKIYNYLTAN